MGLSKKHTASTILWVYFMRYSGICYGIMGFAANNLMFGFAQQNKYIQLCKIHRKTMINPGLLGVSCLRQNTFINILGHSSMA